MEKLTPSAQSRYGMNFQTPALDKLVITHLEFCYGGKER